MRHQLARKKLNLRAPHKKSLLRNQVIQLIENGNLTTTKTHVKEVRKLAEKLITIAKVGNEFNARRRAKSLLPYKESALIKLFKVIAPKYVDRAGGYTRIIPMGQRASDTATIARLEWV